MARSPSSDRDKPTTPKTAPVTTPTPMLDHSFTLQTVIELQRTVVQLDTKIGRLIDDVKEQGSSLDELKHKATFIKGGLVVGGVLITAFVGFVAWILNAKWDTVIAAINAINKVSP